MKIFWLLIACNIMGKATVIAQDPVAGSGLLIDLNADLGITLADGDKVESWYNQVRGNGLDVFEKQDKGRMVPGSGRPSLKEHVAAIRGHNAVFFLKQELYNTDEEATDSLIQGSGFTWVVILMPYKQSGELQEVNTFFGNLKNGGNYEGLWGNLSDDNRVWTGARNGVTFGRWDSNNPFICTTQKLDSGRFYLLAGRMASGTGTVVTEIFINDFGHPAASGLFPVNVNANASKMAIGEERDATNHPGVEAFKGAISRFLLYKRPLSDAELQHLGKNFMHQYGIR